MSGNDLTGEFLTEDVDLTPIKFLVDRLPRTVEYRADELSQQEFDTQQQSFWYMPEEYKQIDIVAHVLNLCRDEGSRQRAASELLLYAERNLLDLLRFLVYLVDTMRSNGIIWGVGRGSSVASYVLFLLGVHRVDSLFYDLDIRDFLR